MAFNKATIKEQNKTRDKAAKMAQNWLIKGFTPEQVADGIWNKIGFMTDVKDGKVRIYGFNSNEKFTARRVLREITAQEIVSYN